MNRSATTKPRRGVAMVCAVLFALVPSACGQPADERAPASTATTSAEAGQPQGPTITIGVSSDHPGLGYLHDGDYVGFDVDVAGYVANKLGYAHKQIVFTSVDPAAAVSSLDDGDVDMVISDLTMDGAQAGSVTFAGPYLTTRPALLVRTSDAGHIREDESLDGQTVCVVTGTDAWTALGWADRAETVEHDSYAQCMTALMVGSVDAVAGDDATLYGLKDGGREHYTVIADTDGQLEQGIAVRKGRSELAKKIAAALRSMIGDGSWDSFADADLSPMDGYRPRRTPQAGEITVR